MILKEKEKTVIQDLQTQEKSCVEKYGRYAEQAKDPELKNLFQTIQKEEQKHYDSLTQVLDGQVPQCDCNDSNGKDYEPKQTIQRQPKQQEITPETMVEFQRLHRRHPRRRKTALPAVLRLFSLMW